jgi:hypothetical protein
MDFHPHTDIVDVLHEMHLSHAMVEPSPEELVIAAVRIARTSGLTWDAIGDVLGVTGSAAHARYGYIPSAELHQLSG